MHNLCLPVGLSKSVIKLVAVLFLVSMANAQDLTGIPSFSSTTRVPGGIVNLSNLNVTIAIPVINKSGRGVPFTFSLVNNSSIYTICVGACGHPKTFYIFPDFTCLGCTIPPDLGWREATSGMGGVGGDEVPCPTNSNNTNQINLRYIDENGTVHPLPSSLLISTDPGCGPDHVSGYATDQSGFFIYASASPDASFVQDRSGNKISSVFTGTFLTDRNGNTLTRAVDNAGVVHYTDTLGIEALTAGFNPFGLSSTYTYPAPNGASVSVVVNYKTYPGLASGFGCPNVSEYSFGSIQLVDTIALPDGTKYAFQYEPTPPSSPYFVAGAVTGRIASITLPTGGTISYSYPGPNGGINCSDGTTMALTVTTADGATSYARSISGNNSTTTVTDALGNQTTVNFLPLMNPNTTVPPTSNVQPQIESQRKVYQGSAQGTPLETSTTCYNGNCSATSVTLPITQISRSRQLASGLQARSDSFVDATSGLTTETDEYDFGANGPGPLLRKSVTSYANLSNNILDRPQRVAVCAPGGSDANCNGSGKVASLTTFGYDETQVTASGAAQHVAVAGSRGNQTSVHRWLNTNNTTLDTTSTYDDAGNALTLTDPLAHTTAFVYGDCNSAFVTSTTLPDTGSPAAHHTISASHDCNTGLQLSSTDQNGSVTKYDYDAMFRPLTVTLPADGNGNKPKTTFSYPDANTVTVQKTITPTLTDSVTGALDGLGRTIHTFHNTPGGKVTSDVTYDVLGRAATASNPYFSTTDPTYGIRQTQYDALGRVTQVTKQDGSASRISYDSNCLTATDETGKPRRSCSDALGRLIEVDEPNAASLGTSATASVVVSGSLTTANSVVDSGTVSLTTGGFTATACYGSSTNSFCSNSPVNSTAAQVTSALASALNVPGSPVSATASGSTLNMVWNTPGPFFPSVSALTTTHDQPNLFPNPSFTGPATMFDHGTGPSLATNPYVTLYQYDTLDNLLRMDQKGSAPADSTQWRTRTFTYDSLSRLQTATSPESGLISYFYDSNGNLLQQVSPTANQNGGAQHTISYCYDALNRVNGKAYSWQNCLNGQLPPGTAVVSYAYDQGTNGVGHLTGVTDQAGSASYSYDALGRLSSEQRTTSGVTKSMSYTYNLDGSIATATYPSGATITDTPDSAGRTLSVVDSGNNINYITSGVYGPHNGLTGFVSGSGTGFSGITSTTVYDVRLQPCRMTASKIGSVPTNCDNSWGELMDLRYRYNLWIGDNGNVTQIVNYRDQSRNQTFTYDPLNRLSSAQNAGTDCSVTVLGGKTKFWGNSYSYDAWGNLLGKNVTKCSSENLTLTVNTNNQLQGFSYDAAGNLTGDGSGNTASYDQENRIIGFAGLTYSYDASGNRVAKASSPTSGTLYWYMAPGLVAESDMAGNLLSEYVYFNGRRVARKDSPGNAVSYYFSDRLNSASVITDSAGNIRAESDYYPWGGELQFVNSDSNRYKFTGLEHDSETNLEHAQFRQLSGPLGRWLTADPYAGSMHLSNPQSLNRYAYVGNNPVSFTDPSGLDWDPSQNYSSNFSGLDYGLCGTDGCPSVFATPGQDDLHPCTGCWTDDQGKIHNGGTTVDVSDTAPQIQDYINLLRIQYIPGYGYCFVGTSGCPVLVTVSAPPPPTRHAVIASPEFFEHEEFCNEHGYPSIYSKGGSLEPPEHYPDAEDQRNTYPNPDPRNQGKSIPAGNPELGEAAGNAMGVAAYYIGEAVARDTCKIK